MTTEDHEPNLLSIEKVKKYGVVLAALCIIVVLYHLVTSFVRGPPPVGGTPPGGSPPNSPPGGGAMQLSDIWPLWGQIVIPNLWEIAVAIVVFSGFVLLVYSLYRKKRSLSLGVIVLLGTLLIIATNLIHGWTIGIETPIGGETEIYQDAIQVSNLLAFISDYEQIQSTLTVHAQTQPPGAVISIYLLSLVFSRSDLIAIALSTLATLSSAFFINGIYRRLFDGNISKYGTLLYLLLPAVQVYYLANIYAIVAAMVLGVTYFYLHENRLLSTMGSSVCLFLGTFTSFLFVYTVLFLFIYESISTLDVYKELAPVEKIKTFLYSIRWLVLISVVVLFAYGLLFLTLGFNYVNAFLYASSIENPGGFMLFSDPAQYFVTRLQNILDIVVFFGPVLSVLCYEGIKVLRKKGVGQTLNTAYHLVLSSLLALFLLFLTGAPKKGETARICMFVLPFLLIPVLVYIVNKDISQKEKHALLVIVFVQAVLMQLFGIYVW